jgi:protein-S-isoprenylcysteine O-methyltransferase Ste14
MIVTITVVVWLVAETVLQVRQYFQGERSTRREWTSFVLLGATFVLAGVLARLARRHLGELDLPIRGTVWYGVIVALLWAGIALRLWSILTLGRYFRGIVHLQPGHRVVREGPYRVLRHPSYAGLLLAFLALALTWANAAAILAFLCCVSAGLAYRIHVEERVLLDGLGEEYARYMRQTNRLVPYLW